MIRVYVAGAYSADNVVDVLQNIGRGEYVAAKLFAQGFAVFCPWHDKDFCIKLPNENFTVKQFYDYSMAWLEVSEAVYLVRGWENSKGVKAEIERARELKIPVFNCLAGLLSWRREKTK